MGDCGSSGLGSKVSSKGARALARVGASDVVVSGGLDAVI